MSRLVLIVCALVAGCGTPEFNTFLLENRTAEPVYVDWDATTDVRVGPIPPGRQTALPVGNAGECATGVFIARTESGREVARRTEPICSQDKWIIVEVNPSPTLSPP
jgi:hypothetical protein